MKNIKWDRKRSWFVLSDGTVSSPEEAFAMESALDVSLSSVRRALASQEGIPVPPLALLPTPEPFNDYLEFSRLVLDGPDAEILFESGENESNMLFFHLSPQGHIRAHFAVEKPRITDKGIVIEITKRVFGEICDVIQLLTRSTDRYNGPSWSFEMICDPRGKTVGSVWRAYKSLCFILTTSPEDLAVSSEGVQLALAVRMF
jgi:hypothetical protein